MLELICKRLLLAIPTLLLVSMMVFGLQKLLPGDPLIAMAGEERDPAVIGLFHESGAAESLPEALRGRAATNSTLFGAL